MQYIYQPYIKDQPVSSLICYNKIEDALESAMTVIRYENGPRDATVCEPVEIEKPQNCPWYVCKVFKVRILNELFDEGTGVCDVSDDIEYILIKQMTLY